MLPYGGNNEDGYDCWVRVLKEAKQVDLDLSLPFALRSLTSQRPRSQFMPPLRLQMGGFWHPRT